MTADAVVVVSELVTNAIEHAGTEWHVVVDVRGRYLVIAVDDELAGCGPEVQRSPAPYVSGLQVVNSVAQRWGWRQHATGKTVWAEILI